MSINMFPDKRGKERERNALNAQVLLFEFAMSRFSWCDRSWCAMKLDEAFFFYFLEIISINDYFNS